MDEVKPEGPDQLALELTDFTTAVRTGAHPRVSGEDALRALRVADAVLQSINTHQWEGQSDGPIGPSTAATLESFIGMLAAR